jgi:hypothetical protein
MHNQDKMIYDGGCNMNKNNKRYKRWTPVVSMAAVLIFFVWGFIEGSFKHSWVIFIASGLAIVVLGILDKNNSGDNSEDISMDITVEKADDSSNQ